MGTLWEARQGLGSPNRSTAQRVRFSSPPSRRLLAPLQTDTQTRPSRTVGSSQADAERCRHTDPRGSKRAQRARADRPPRCGQRCLPRRTELQPGGSSRPASQPGADLSYALARGPEGSGPAPGGRRPSAALPTFNESWGHSAAPQDRAFDHPPLANGKRAEPCEAAAGRALWVLLQTKGRRQGWLP